MPGAETSGNAADRGLRAIALFEGLKGILAIMVGIGILALRRQDFEALARGWIDQLSLDPADGFATWLLQTGAKLNQSGIGLFAGLALAYAAMRLIEACGLWLERRWAAWFGVLSGGVYIPFEMWEIGHGPSLWNVGALLINLVVVAYLAIRLRTPRPLA